MEKQSALSLAKRKRKKEKPIEEKGEVSHQKLSCTFSLNINRALKSLKTSGKSNQYTKQSGCQERIQEEDSLHKEKAKVQFSVL